MRWKGFSVIPLTTLYDEYIDRSKLSEQKNQFDYLVPPPSRGSEQLVLLQIMFNEIFPSSPRKLIRHFLE